MDGIEIVTVRSEDLDEILRIQTECGLSEWTREGYLEELARTDSLVLAAKIGTEIAGFLVGRSPFASRGESQQAEIYNIGTRPEYRRRGVGSSLLSAFIKTCEERRSGSIWLDVRSSNLAAQAFYRRYDFIKTGTRKAFYTQPTEDADVMCRPIKERPPEQSSQGA